MNNFKIIAQPLNWLVAFILVAFVAGCGGSSGNGSRIADTTAPTVISTAPADLAPSIAINTNITATFSEAMSPSTINSTTFSLKQGTTPVAGTVAYVGNTATFHPTSNLSGTTAYTATITTGAKDLAGNALAAPKIWTFTTNTTIDTTAPTVTSVFPANTATGILLNANIVANFSETMDPSTINTSTFTLMQQGSSTPVNGAVTGSAATFHPNINLAPGTLYTATITTVAKDLAGNPLATAKIWSFTTGTTTGATPANLGEAGRFVILASQGISTTGTTAISNGDIGVEDQARSSMTGFTTGAAPGSFTELSNGLAYASDDVSPLPIPSHYATLPVGATWGTTLAMINQSRTDLGNAYTFLATDPNPGAPTQVLATELGGLTLTPGVYKTASSVTITTGTLILDARGDPNAVWIFSIDGNLTTGAPGGSMTFVGGVGQAKNVFWRVAGTTTIGAGTTFYGNVLDYLTINVNSGANVIGKLFSKTAAVTLIADTVTNAQ